MTRQRSNAEHFFTAAAPIWRRSLMESGMRKKPTALDRIIVAAFVLIAVGMVLGVLLR